MATPDHSTLVADRLAGLVRRTRRRVLGHGLVRVLATGGGALLAAAWAIGAGPDPEGFLAWGLVLTLVLILITVVRNFLVRPLVCLRTARDLVARLEGWGDFSNLLVAAEEAHREPGRWSDDDPVGRELKRRLFQRADGLLDLVGPAEAYPIRRARAWTTAGVVVGLLAMVYAAWAPGEFGTGLVRLATPWPEVKVTPTGGIYGIVAEKYVVAGGAVTLEAWDFAGGTGNAVCEIRTGRGVWQPLPSRQEPVHAKQPGHPPAYRRWTAPVAEVREDFTWRFRRGDLVSAEQRLVVRQHPLVTALSARVEPPAYTRVPPRNLQRLPVRFEVPAGSSLVLRGRTNHPVIRAQLVTGTGDTLAVAIDSVALEVRLEVSVSMTFALEVEDAWGLRNHAPLHYEVTAAADEDPLVELFRPADDGVLPLNGELVLEVGAADDFGLDRVSLLVRTLSGRENEEAIGWRGGVFWPGPAEGWQEWPVASGDLAVRAQRLESNSSSLGASFRLEVRTGDLDLVPGDVLEIVAEARDNREPPPAGLGRSRALRLVLPSAADVLDLQAEAAEEHRSDLEEMRRRSGELESDLDRLTRELMKNPLPDWARQQEMEKAIQRQQALQEELSRVAGELERELDNLARGQLTSENQLEKAEQVSELLSQEGSERLQALLERLEEGASQVSPDEVARAMEEVARNQKEMARKLDAALAMLKRMAQEQELEGLTALVEQMMRKQQELAELSRELADRQQAESDGAGEENEGGEEGEETETPSAEELARRQEALARDLEQLQEKLEQALAEMKEQGEESSESGPQSDMAEALEEALEKLEEQQSSSKMDQASEQLQQMDPQKAAEMQEQALRDLGSLYHVMLQTQQAMQMAMKMEQVSSLRGLAADLLAVSTRQEEIVALIPPRLRDLRTLELTRNQHRIQKATIAVRTNLSGLLDEAPTRILKLLAKLDGLIEEMGAGLRAMEENRAAIARSHARASLASANKIVIGLLTEAQMSGGSGGGSGSPQSSASEQLQEMIRKQAELNGATDELRKMLADRGMSQESRAQMDRLGQEQAELADRMGKLAEGRAGQGTEQGQGESGGQGGEGGEGGEGREGGERPGEQGRGEGPEEIPETVRPESDLLLGDLSKLGEDMETVGQEIGGGLVSEETLRRQEKILGRMLDARNSVRERDYSNRRESRTSGRLYAEQMGRDGGTDNEGESLRQRYQPLEKAPLEYRDLVRRYFTALDALRKLDLEDAPSVPDTRKDTP